MLSLGLAGNRPDLVVLSSGIWEVVDRRLVDDDRYRRRLIEGGEKIDFETFPLVLSVQRCKGRVGFRRNTDADLV